MNGTSPLVTIGIPFFNPGPYIIYTLQSVYDQSYANIELLLYNDGSTDHSYQLVLQWLENNEARFTKVSVINGLVNKGVGWACDSLLKESAGVYFQMLGADDLIYRSKISSQVTFLETNPAYALTYANMDRIDEKGLLYPQDYFEHQQFSTLAKGQPPCGNTFTELVKENFIPASSVLLRKSVVEEAGGYDAGLKSEDWDLWLRISKQHKIWGTREVVGAYRILPTSAMHSSRNKVRVLDSLNVALVKHKGFSRATDRVIKEHLYKNTIEMYRLGYISARWRGQLFKNKPGLKPLIYQLLMLFGIKLNQKR